VILGRLGEEPRGTLLFLRLPFSTGVPAGGAAAIAAGGRTAVRTLFTLEGGFLRLAFLAILRAICSSDRGVSERPKT
jgi:hypothetical protein